MGVGHLNFPATAVYREEQSQPHSFNVDCGIYVAVNPDFLYIIPILSDAAIREYNLVTVRKVLRCVHDLRQSP